MGGAHRPRELVALDDRADVDHEGVDGLVVDGALLFVGDAEADGGGDARVLVGEAERGVVIDLRGVRQ